MVKDAATGQMTVLFKDKEKQTEQSVEIVMHETGEEEDAGRAFMLSFDKPDDDLGSVSLVRDEEHSAGARITLERDGSIAPFAITCGIYGGFLYHRLRRLRG